MIEWLLWPFVSALVASGIFIFMRGLELTVAFFHAHEQLVYLLPLAGLAIYFAEKVPAFKNLGNSELILEEIKTPRKQISWKLAPWICIMTWWSHVFGASAGREGTAIQMGASLAETAGAFGQKIFPNKHLHRPLLLRMGLAGGFAVAFGAPWAGLMFALEHPRHWHRGLFNELPFLALTSWTSFEIASWLGLERRNFPQPDILLSTNTLFSYFLVALGLALFALLYQNLTTVFTLRFSKLPRWFSLFLGGCLLSGTAFALHSAAWHSLGDQLFERSFSGSVEAWEGPLKLLLTAITNASGFRGGEVVPLMSSGALLGNSFAALGGLSVTLIATVGLVVLFSNRLHCPLAGIAFLLERVSPGAALGAILPVLLSWRLARFFETRRRSVKKTSTV